MPCPSPRPPVGTRTGWAWRGAQPASGLLCAPRGCPASQTPATPRGPGHTAVRGARGADSAIWPLRPQCALCSPTRRDDSRKCSGSWSFPARLLEPRNILITGGAEGSQTALSLADPMSQSQQVPPGKREDCSPPWAGGRKSTLPPPGPAECGRGPRPGLREGRPRGGGPGPLWRSPSP